MKRGTRNSELGTRNSSQRLAGGAVKIMDEKISDTQYMVSPGKDKVIKVGKKFFRVVAG
jgi:hypothetical protein